MSDELLMYYNRELAFVRRLGAEFAEAYPRIAGRLRLGADKSDDPHVARMIEAFAFLNARIRAKLDDDFPEITDAMLGILYPHYLAPIPSMAIVQFVLDRGQAELAAGYRINRGTVIETEPVGGEPCRFRTAYPVTLYPINVAAASLDEAPFQAPNTMHAARSLAVLKLRLECFAKEMKFARLDLSGLRFFLSGQGQHIFPLYELLFNNVLEIAIAESASDPNPIILKPSVIQAVGFGEHESVLDYPKRSFYGYRLLTEYFAFPEKYLFFELAGLDQKLLARTGRSIEIYFYLSRVTSDLTKNVNANTFRLGCTPVVNLYSQRAEPIQLTHALSEYRVVPDARRPLGHEVYSIERVTATSQDGEVEEYFPFYSLKHGVSPTQRRTFWTSTRKQAEVKSGKSADSGTEVYLSLVDLDFKPLVPIDWTLNVETTCFNRDLPHRLPFGGDQPQLHLVEGAPLQRTICLTPPTPTIRPPIKERSRWRLISHLALNQLSIASMTNEGSALQEILRLYDFTDSAETRAMIEGIISVSSRRVVGPVGALMRGAFCRGVEVTVEFDENRFAGSGVFLFATVLERFFGLYCTINSFSSTIARTKQRREELHRWPPRAGERVLL